MILEKHRINGRELTLAVGWQEDAALRQQLHPLTREIFGFDFEGWYQAGYWSDSCIPYSLLEGEGIAAHITVSRMRFLLYGEEREYVQLGTVLTAPACRGQGLSRALMERVLADWREGCDLVFLFANNSVLDFYPRFGFVPLTEQETTFPLEAGRPNLPVRQLDMADEGDRALLVRMAETTAPQGVLSMVRNPQLVMFYCQCFEGLPFREQVYWLESLPAAVVARQEGDTLVISDIFSPAVQDVRAVAAALAKPGVSRAVLEFLPADPGVGCMAPYVDEEGGLFAQGRDLERLQARPFRFPILSHT